MQAIIERTAGGLVAARRRREPAPVPAPTGRRVMRDGQEWLLHTRHVRALPRAVWAALTRPELLELWVGTWRLRTGGTVEFVPAFEGGDLLPLVYAIDHVTPGRSFAVSMTGPEGADPSQVTVELTPAGVGRAAGTVVTLAHTVGNRALAPHLATGDEYYLDRLVALLEERHPTHLADFDEYFVRQAAHYRRLFPTQPDGPLPG